MEKQIVKVKRCPDGHDCLVVSIYSFCPTCGKKLIEVEVPGCPKCQLAWDGDIQFCPLCGLKREPVEK